MATTPGTGNPAVTRLAVRLERRSGDRAGAGGAPPFDWDACSRPLPVGMAARPLPRPWLAQPRQRPDASRVHRRSRRGAGPRRSPRRAGAAGSLAAPPRPGRRDAGRAARRWGRSCAGSGPVLRCWSSRHGRSRARSAVSSTGCSMPSRRTSSGRSRPPGRQLDAIDRLEADGRLAAQPRVVRTVAAARRETPEATLAELASRLELHRSAVQRALERLERLALHEADEAERPLSSTPVALA